MNMIGHTKVKVKCPRCRECSTCNDSGFIEVDSIDIPRVSFMSSAFAFATINAHDPLEKIIQEAIELFKEDSYSSIWVKEYPDGPRVEHLCIMGEGEKEDFNFIYKWAVDLKQHIGEL